MLTQKKDRKEESPVKITSAKIIKINAPAKKGEPVKKHTPAHKTTHPHRLPPRNEFNTGYIKGKDNDTL